MSTRYLSLHGFAKRIGLAYSTLRSYQREKRLPEPDAIIGEGNAVTYGWLPETIDQWQANRPGRGNWKRQFTHSEKPLASTGK